MAFEVVEHKLVSKTGNFFTCEDQIVATDYHAAVIDGATSKLATTYQGKTTGRFAAEILKNAIARFPVQVTFDEAVDLLTYALAKHYHRNNEYDYLKEHPLERPTASVAIYSDYQREVWLIGDCRCMIDKKVYNHRRRPEEVIARIRALYLEIALQQGASVASLQHRDIGREYILPLLKGQVAFQNSHSNHPYGYSAIDGFPVVDKHLSVIPVDGDDVSIVLASDGYPVLYRTLEQSENYLYAALKKDPLCFREFLNTKGVMKGNISFDDRAYLRLNTD
ncbi:hypothetical protein [uncultured Microscilla sp.]|uniref:hypothetical protein n=1 Tax=uncultured Microscilla sp. TaxID=432653 RepID=UPI0026273146|nr:hypothetical protein [uncultured Microscilla sp.]